MRLLFIILNTLISIGVLRCQLSDYYSFKTSNKYIDCKISLYKNGGYIMELRDEGEFPILYATLSYGTYSISRHLR